MDHTPCWRAITSGVAAGRPPSLRAYYERYALFMLRETRRLTDLDEAAAWDLVHDALLKAVRCMPVMEHEGQVTNWTRTVVASVAYDHLRERRRRQSHLRLLADQLEEAADEDSVRFREEARLQWLEEQLRALPAELRQLLHWRYRLGWTLQRIADKLGWKTGAVDGRLRRAVRRLRIAAESEWED